jgi:hypothetical protein
MALWGNIDSVYSAGTVTVDYDALTVTGVGATFNTAGIKTGDVIQIGAGSTYGEAVIASVSSASTISIASTQFLSGDAISGAVYNIGQQPKYALGVGETSRGTVGPALVYGVDANEVGTASTTNFAVTHSGWVAVAATYIDCNNNVRYKHEVLVAGGISAPDADDDALFPDPAITITTQPASVGVGTTETATFSVVASVFPTYAPLSYQWYENDGGGFDAISGATETSVSITNTDASKDGYEYRVTIVSGDTSVTSGIATMTVS